MAVISVEDLTGALRLGDSAAEEKQVTRLLAYGILTVEQHLRGATVSDAVKNEAIIRLAGYLYDAPTASAGQGFANALQNSGAASILFPYLSHHVGILGDG